MKRHPVRSRRAGFTLLELVIAMGLLTIIVGMVFGIARTSLALGKTIVETQNEEMEHQAFMDLVGRTFGTLPGNARLDLQVQDSGTHYLSDLTLQNVPLGFTWGGVERVAKAVRLSTVKRRSGYLDIVLSYYENEILEDPEDAVGRAPTEEPFAEIVLLEDVAYFEWRVLDGNSLEWLYDWEFPSRLPLQLELVMAVGAKGEEMRQVFWLPPKQNPLIQMRQMMQDGEANPPQPAVNIPGQTPGGGNRPGGGSPGIPGININPPGGAAPR
ncbi:MAG: prepilin-type N-terminal cleavage/methylation domain-containing protein [Akkermansiaceae bacterium]|jgi:prepilin-type N-terminal cleavage/methylation domain-containing protein|nr:prepilin-type N-terminal cleavage/methylation domain-containing protein [Akkermansiaceae bacterium]